jgi:site-specific DNA-methyltransferase (adenine-specific)
VANGRYSVCGSFTQPEGNIRYNRVNHKWVNDKCDFCGAKEGVYDRGEELETHAYEFIHTNEPKEIFNMKFDVIVGNPPYQLNDGGGTGSSASPIYHNFITQAKKMNPKYLTMIIPSRWFSGGKGLDDFRDEMLNDSRISNLVDYSDSNECFPGVDIAGGICYFLWDREHHGECSVENIHNGKSTISKRRLNEFSSTFVRDSVAISIIKKIKAKSDTFLDEIVSSRRPFGLDSKERPLKKGDLTLIWSGGEGPYDQTKVKTGINLIKKWKVLISKASHDHGGQSGKDGTRRILSRIEVIPPDTVCTESYLIIGPYNTKREAVNMANYLRLKFSRFLISTILLTQNITKDKFQFVPHVDLSDCLTDSKLYKMYELTNEEISYIESMIRPMELEGNE